MPNPLLPELNGQRLTVDVALKQPTIIRDRIAKLADETLLLPRLFRPNGAKIEGAGLLYTTLKAADFFTAGTVEKRAPLTEYKLVELLDPENKLQPVEDFGASVEVAEEDIIRGNWSRIDQATIQLSNDLLRLLDLRAMDALNAVDIESVGTAVSWEDLETIGPDTSLTPAGDRPTAHFAQAQELADLEEMNVVHDTLLVNPSQARQLKTAYAENLDAMLKSAGLKMYSNPRIPDGTAFVCQGGQVGVVGFELPLTVRVIDQPEKRGKLIQAFCVPAIAVDRPHAIKKIVGLSA